METYIGVVKTAILYILGGACGSLFGCVTQCCNPISVYGEVPSALYALFGAYLAVILFKSDYFDRCLLFNGKN